MSTSPATNYSTNNNHSSSTAQVQPLPDSNGFQVIPFAVAMPSLQDTTEVTSDTMDASHHTMAMMGDHGIVGTILMLGCKSIMIWVGWGQLQLFGNTEQATTPTSTCGTGTPSMGQLLLAMPRTFYQGAFGGPHSQEPSCSTLVGSATDQTLGHQMASRLSMRTGRAVMVSCQLSGENSSSSSGPALDGMEWSTGLDSEIIAQRAAAIAEKEISRILQAQQQAHKE